MKYLLLVPLFLFSCRDFNGERIKEVRKLYPNSTIYQDPKYNGRFIIVDSSVMQISITAGGSIYDTKYLIKIQ